LLLVMSPDWHHPTHMFRGPRLPLILMVLGAALLAVAFTMAPARLVPGQSTPRPLVQDTDAVMCGDTPYVEVNIDTAPRLQVELAVTPAERQTGLMARSSLPADQGMLFVFPTPSVDGFWMHDTLIPLSIAWIDRYGNIVDIQEMEPLSDTVHYPSGPYSYALEANAGWFLEHGVGVGQIVTMCLQTNPPS
jgi:uncharacterized membrane protein (UPF0127 family)